METRYISDLEQLEAVCQQWKNAPWLAVDTEFMRETTYFANLCLIQIADEQLAVAIDPLVIQSLAPLKQLFRQDTTIVFHAASQDLEIFYQLFDELPKVLFDTQIAAAIAGHQEQIGYAKLAEEVCKVSLNKQYSRTDWSMRPLSDKQISYALDDVIYLGQIYTYLVDKLTQQNRIDWLEAEFSRMASPETYINDPMKMWKKVKQHQRLKPRDLLIVQHLAAWRETEALNKNRPRRQILKDEVIIDIARIQPKSKQDWQQIRGLSPAFAERLARKLPEIIQQALKTDKTEWPTLPKIPPKASVHQEAIADLLYAALRLIADEANINPAMIGNRKQALLLLQDAKESKLMEGWRKKLAGDKLLRLINGELSLQIKNEQLVFIEAE